jgi:hypothetical protein
MKPTRPVLLITSQDVELHQQDFYRALDTIINRASPPAHMSADFMGDPLTFGLVLYLPRVYETIRKLKEQNDATSSDSRKLDA